MQALEHLLRPYLALGSLDCYQQELAPTGDVEQLRRLWGALPLLSVAAGVVAARKVTEGAPWFNED